MRLRTDRIRIRALNFIFILLFIFNSIVSSSFAVTYSSEEYSNNFSIGTLQIELIQNIDRDNDGIFSNDEINVTTEDEDIEIGTMVIPNETLYINHKIQSLSKRECYVFLVIGLPCAKIKYLSSGSLVEKDCALLTAVPNLTEWTEDTSKIYVEDGYEYHLYYHSNPIAENESTESPIEYYQVTDYSSIVSSINEKCAIRVKGFALQSYGFSSALEAWQTIMG